MRCRAILTHPELGSVGIVTHIISAALCSVGPSWPLKGLKQMTALKLYCSCPTVVLRKTSAEVSCLNRVLRLHVCVCVHAGTGLEQYLGSAFCSIDAADLWSQPPDQAHSSQPGKNFCFRMCA